MPQLPPGQAAASSGTADWKHKATLAVRQSQSSGRIWDRGRESTPFYDIIIYLTKLSLDMNDCKLQTLN